MTTHLRLSSLFLVHIFLHSQHRLQGAHRAKNLCQADFSRGAILIHLVFHVFSVLLCMARRWFTTAVGFELRLGCMKIRSAFSDEVTAKRVAGTAYLWQATGVKLPNKIARMRQIQTNMSKSISDRPMIDLLVVNICIAYNSLRTALWDDLSRGLYQLSFQALSISIEGFWHQSIPRPTKARHGIPDSLSRTGHICQICQTCGRFI